MVAYHFGLRRMLDPFPTPSPAFAALSAAAFHLREHLEVDASFRMSDVLGLQVTLRKHILCARELVFEAINNGLSTFLTSKHIDTNHSVPCRISGMVQLLQTAFNIAAEARKIRHGSSRHA